MSVFSDYTIGLIFYVLNILSSFPNILAVAFWIILTLITLFLLLKVIDFYFLIWGDEDNKLEDANVLKSEVEKKE